MVNLIAPKTIKPGHTCGFCSVGGRHDLCPGGVLNGDQVTIITCTCKEHSILLRCVMCGARGEAVNGETWTCMDPEACADRTAKSHAETVRSLYGDLEDPESPRTTPKSLRPPREPAKPKTGKCLCCGETTGGGNYRPGHDSKHLTMLATGVKEGLRTLEDAQSHLPTDALRAKLAKRVA